MSVLCPDLTGRLLFSNELPLSGSSVFQMLRLSGFCLVQENSRLESELLETGEKLAEYESLASKLQRNLENVLAEKVNVNPPLCSVSRAESASRSWWWGPWGLLPRDQTNAEPNSFWLKELQIPQPRCGPLIDNSKPYSKAVISQVYRGFFPKI